MKTRNVDYIKNDETCCIGSNVRTLRLEKGLGQTELVTKMQLLGVSINRQTLVKIESGTQHIKVGQLRAIKEILQVSYEDLLKSQQ